jgi:hypothetical protein
MQCNVASTCPAKAWPPPCTLIEPCHEGDRGTLHATPRTSRLSILSNASVSGLCRLAGTAASSWKQAVACVCVHGNWLEQLEDRPSSKPRCAGSGQTAGEHMTAGVHPHPLTGSPLLCRTDVAKRPRPRTAASCHWQAITSILTRGPAGLLRQAVCFSLDRLDSWLKQGGRCVSFTRPWPPPRRRRGPRMRATRAPRARTHAPHAHRMRASARGRGAAGARLTCTGPRARPPSSCTAPSP